jgi:hypothetical protein
VRRSVVHLLSARRLTLTLGAALLVVLASAPGAAASQPGRWLLTGASSVPDTYWQGLASDPPDENLYFVGVFEGLWRTTPSLRQTAGVANAIPPAVTATEGYNHIGDPTWNPGEGGRLILPLECYSPTAVNTNTCGTGAFGVADPATLGFRYYVKLDPAQIQKAGWAETSPNGALIWTSSGDDLLAYRSSDVAAANAGPGGPLLSYVRRLPGAVPPGGVTGAVFRHGRLLLAGARHRRFAVWSVDTRSGERRLEVRKRICGESEGLDTIPTLDGRLHWLISPYAPGCELTFGPSSALLHLVPRRGQGGLGVRVLGVTGARIPGRVVARVRVARGDRPLRHARVRFADGTARTNARGRARIATTLEVPGRFKAYARKRRRYGLSDLVPVGIASLGASPAPQSDAG